MKIYSINKVEIRLSNERLNHILTNHPEMIEFISDTPNIIEDPDFVFEGIKGELIAAKRRNKFFLVVIYREKGEEGFVITAFKARNISYLFKRKLLWKKE